MLRMCAGGGGSMVMVMLMLMLKSPPRGRKTHFYVAFQKMQRNNCFPAPGDRF